MDKRHFTRLHLTRKVIIYKELERVKKFKKQRASHLKGVSHVVLFNQWSSIVF